MPHRFEGVFYVETEPAIHCRNGMFHISYQISENSRFEVVLPPHVYFKAFANAGQVAHEFREGLASGKIIPVDFDSKFEKRFVAKDRA